MTIGGGGTAAGLKRSLLLGATTNAALVVAVAATVQSGAGSSAVVLALAGVAAFAGLNWRAARRLDRERRALLEENQALTVLSRQDPLLGIANRRAFDLTLGREWSRASRHGQELSLLLIDVDRFKDFNDRYGHPAGDACLRECAAVIGGALRRPADLLARWGGEELAVLLPDTGPAGAGDVARRIHSALESAGIRHDGVPAGRVTVSIGAASCRPGVCGTPDELVGDADAAAYAAKRQGRDRTAFAGREDAPLRLAASA